MTFPRIGVTLGDPGGIGPEVVFKALSDISSLPKAHFILFGNLRFIREEMKALGLEPESFLQGETGQKDHPRISVKEVADFPPNVKKGRPSAENGACSFLSFEAAVHEAHLKNIQAVVTAPISKHSWQLAGIQWAGHTDFLESRYPKAIMSFWSDRLTVALFSHHLPLKKALKKIEKNSLCDFFLDLHTALTSARHKPVEILVSGLNPHAGESGLLGHEEKREIVPAILKAGQKGLNIKGPFPPDIIFRKALSSPDAIVVSLYHDQGLIPFKLLSFEEGVNATLGLPFVRTSPDHGTAFDIAGKGLANPMSMSRAIHLATDLLQSH
jgi:4-hydroxythreonine-4-phosphate dehydrogenase